jgi:hypothetical protein
MLLKPLFTSLIVCLHRFCIINLLLNVCFVNHRIDFLRTFRCLCFPFLRPYNAYKLDYRFTPCVVLGYSSSHLGYHYLDLLSKCLYISRHLRFNEHVFPFLESAHLPPPNSHTHPPTIVTHLPSLTIFPSTTPSASPPISSNPLSPYHHLPPYMLIILQVQGLQHQCCLCLRLLQLLSL